MLTSQMVVAGTYDPDKQRARILLQGLRERHIALHEVNVSIWTGVRDKGTLTALQKVAAALRQVLALPLLAFRYTLAPAHGVLLVPYPGVFDVIVLAPIARLRGARLVWDLFISPFDTMVNDRRTHSRYHPLAAALWGAEWLASRLADVMFIDTQAHARRFERLVGLAEGQVAAVPLGTDPLRFPPRDAAVPQHRPLRVIFYGQFIPLHGLDTIVDAFAQLAQRKAAVELTLVGDGQEAGRIDARIRELGLTNVQREGWVAPDRLPAMLHEHDVGLGIFGSSDKALTVIPNKVYELAATQMPIVTADTPALADFAVGHPWLIRVPPMDATALANALERIARDGIPAAATPLPVVGPAQVADAMLLLLEKKS